MQRTNSDDDGSQARFVYKVFDPLGETILDYDGEEWLIRETEAGRYQFKLLIAREAGNVKELWIQRVPAAGAHGSVRNLLNLKQPEVGRLVEFLKNLDAIPVDGETSVRVDDELLRDLFADPDAAELIYRQNRERFRRLIATDESARDVVALAARRSVVARFRLMLDNDAYFDNQVDAVGSGSTERVWQRFFEENPWLLGVNLMSQLLTSWSDDRLEQVVAGSSVTGPGKRADALMRTSGRVRSMVFAEIKTHRTPLLAADAYRAGCWAPSRDLAGGVAQVQGTVHRAVAEIGERILSVGDDGSEIPGDFTYLIRPKSVLIVGQLTELEGAAGGDHPDKIRSFELFRRNLWEPEVLTFDELHARAEWVVESAASEADAGLRAGASQSA